MEKHIFTIIVTIVKKMCKKDFLRLSKKNLQKKKGNS